jgi:hypothetical protein
LKATLKYLGVEEPMCLNAAKLLTARDPHQAHRFAIAYPEQAEEILGIAIDRIPSSVFELMRPLSTMVDIDPSAVMVRAFHAICRLAAHDDDKALGRFSDPERKALLTAAAQDGALAEYMRDSVALTRAALTFLDAEVMINLEERRPGAFGHLSADFVTEPD